MTRGSAIQVSCNIASGPTSITANVIRALPTAGATTPALFRGIDISCCVDLVQNNRVSGARIGIDVHADNVPSLVRRNRLVGDPGDAESTGVEVSGDGTPARVRANHVSGYARGVDVRDWVGHLIRDNELAGNAEPCVEVADDSGPANTWIANLGCPGGPVLSD